MSSVNSISADKLARLIGTPKCPVVVDVRTSEDFNAEPRLIPEDALIHESVVKRMDALPGYRPVNLPARSRNSKRFARPTPPRRIRD